MNVNVDTEVVFEIKVKTKPITKQRFIVHYQIYFDNPEWF